MAKITLNIIGNTKDVDEKVNAIKKNLEGIAKTPVKITVDTKELDAAVKKLESLGGNTSGGKSGAAAQMQELGNAAQKTAGQLADVAEQQQKLTEVYRYAADGSKALRQTIEEIDTAVGESTRTIREYDEAGEELVATSERITHNYKEQRKALQDAEAAAIKEWNTEKEIAAERQRQEDASWKQHETRLREEADAIAAATRQEIAYYNQLEDAKEQALLDKYEAQHRQTVLKEANQSYSDATRAVKEYYASLAELNKTQTDIRLTGNGWASESGNWDELAKKLNRTTTAFNELTNAENIHKMSAEQQVSLQRLMATENEKYSISVEKNTNKAAASAQEMAQAHQRAMDEANQAYAQYVAGLEAKKPETALQKQINALTGVSNEAKSAKDSMAVFDKELSNLDAKTGKVVEALTDEARAMHTAEVRAKSFSNSYGDLIDHQEKMFDGQVVEATSKYRDELGNVTTVMSRLKGEAAEVTTVTRTQSEAMKKEADSAELAAKRNTLLGDSLDRIVAKMAAWQILGNIIASVIGQFKQAVTTIREVDDALVTIRKVTGFSDSQIAEISKQAYSTASKYGVGAADYLSDVAAFSRAGYKEQAAALAELSAKTQIVGDTTADVANQFLLSVDAAYKYKGSIEELTKVLDGANEIDNKYATSIEKIAEGMGIVAPVAKQVNVGVDELAAAIGTITAVTQRSGNEAARALRALFLNIVGDTKTEIDEGVTWTTGEIEGLQDVIKTYAKDAYDAAKASGEVLNPMEAIAGLAQSLEDGVLTADQLTKMVSDIGGKLRSSQLLAIIQNWDMYTSMLEDFGGAVGSADKEVENALDSWNRKTEILKNTFTEFISNVIETDAIKGFIDLLTLLVDTLDIVAPAINLLLKPIFTMVEGLSKFIKLLKEDLVEVQSLSQDAARDLSYKYGVFSAEGANNALQSLYNNPEGYSKEEFLETERDLKSLVEFFQSSANTIKSEYEQLLAEARSLGVDITRTVYGNIDTNNRQILEWTEENLNRFSDAIKSWGYKKKELEGTISTVMGTSSEYDGIEIAFSPILQTPTGPVLLSADTVDKYIFELIAKAGEGWTNEDLFALDTEGLIIDGRKIQNLIADIGDSAYLTGEAMHYVGQYGALALSEEKTAAEEAEEATEGVGEAATKAKKDVDSLATSINSNVFPALKSLTAAYNEVYENGKVSFSTLADIADQFGDVSNIDLFISRLQNVGSSGETVNDVLTDLAFALLENDDYAKTLANSTHSLVSAMLEETGVANSDKVALELIAAAKEAVAGKSVLATGKVEDFIDSLSDETSYSETARNVLIRLAAQMVTTSNTNMSFSGQISQLKNLALAAGIAGAAVESVTSGASGILKPSGKGYLAAPNATAQINNLFKLIEEGTRGTSIDYVAPAPATTGGGSSGGGSRSGGSTKATEDPVITGIKAELQARKDNVALLKSELSLMQERGDSTEAIAAKQREIQNALHQEADYLRSVEERWGDIGVDQSDVNALSQEWWKIQNDINSALEKANEELEKAAQENLEDIVSMRKQELSFLEASGASTEEQVAKIKEIQASLHEQAEYMRSIGASEEDILKLSTEWWSYQNKITSLLEKQAKEAEEKRKEAIKAAKEQALALLDTEEEIAKGPLEKQLELLEAQRDALKDQNDEAEKLLAVEKARIALENAQRERTVRQYNSSTGQWEWVANASTVASARETLAQAEQALADFYENQAIEALKDKISNIGDSYDALRDAVNSFAEAVENGTAQWNEATDFLMAAVNEFGGSVEYAAVSAANAFTEIVRGTAGSYGSGSGGGGSRNTGFYDYVDNNGATASDYAALAFSGGNAVEAYRRNGNVGDYYLTHAGTWAQGQSPDNVIALLAGGVLAGQITEQQAAEKLAELAGREWLSDSKRAAYLKAANELRLPDPVSITKYDNGGILHGMGGIKATGRDELVLPPGLSNGLLTAEQNGSFNALLNHLGIVTGVAQSYGGYGGSISSTRIGTQNNGNTYQFGSIVLTENQARGMTVYDLAQMSSTLSLYSAS